jgi:peptidoglycan hydrolase-like protein with peptidoglycan-binding domain
MRVSGVRTLGDLPFGPGSTDEYVLEVQRQLVSIGYYLVPTGAYDAQTAEAVRSFQLSRNLAPTGVVDLTTLDALALAANEVAPVRPIRPGLQEELQITGQVPVSGVALALGLGWLLFLMLGSNKRESFSGLEDDGPSLSEMTVKELVNQARYSRSRRAKAEARRELSERGIYPDRRGRYEIRNQP